MNIREAYVILGLVYDAPYSDVVAAWRKLRSQCHPDKGGTIEGFQQLTKAWEAAAKHAQRQRDCPLCSGTGKRTITKGWARVQMPCGMCHGRGVAEPDQQPADADGCPF